MTKRTEIRFYRANEKPYGAFSNLYRRKVLVDGNPAIPSQKLRMDQVLSARMMLDAAAHLRRGGLAIVTLKGGGKNPLDGARRGIEVQMPMRRSLVETLDVISYTGEEVRLDLRVSSGTYVRSIAHALGGHCRTLRRLEIGPFSVDEADPARFIPADEALARL